MKPRHTARGASIIALLDAAPAFPSEVAAELGIPKDQAMQCLRRLIKNGKVTRRVFHHDTIKEKWLYLLPEHQQLIKGK